MESHKPTHEMKAENESMGGDMHAMHKMPYKKLLWMVIIS